MIKGKNETIRQHIEYQVIAKQQMFEEKNIMADERKRIADDEDVLRTATLLFQRDLNCPIATKLRNERAQAALNQLLICKKKA